MFKKNKKGFVSALLGIEAKFAVIGFILGVAAGLFLAYAIKTGMVPIDFLFTCPAVP